jgi:acetamidase/formamidase
LPSREQRQVRAENADAIMSIGVAGSLDQAMRAAISDLARWLESEYKLTSAETALLLGVEMKYDIADMVPPQLGCVARLPKSVLNKIRNAK